MTKRLLELLADVLFALGDGLMRMAVVPGAYWVGQRWVYAAAWYLDEKAGVLPPAEDIVDAAEELEDEFGTDGDGPTSGA